MLRCLLCLRFALLDPALGTLRRLQISGKVLHDSS
jgi:hypothetical protein